MKTIIFVVAGLAVLAVIIYLVIVPKTSDLSQNNGGIVFAVSDKAADMGTISAINLTVDSLQIHSSAEGWITITQNDAVFDLLKLKATGAAQLLAQAQLEAGQYDQVRLDVKSVTVVDAQGQKSAKLPSNILRFNAMVEITEGATSSVILDFKADESLHITGKGEYILFPVLQVEAKNEVSVSISADERVIVSGGNLTSETAIGMDVNGDAKANLKVPADAIIKIENNLIIIEGGAALEPIGQTCLATCYNKCETSVLAQCKAQCDIDANLACSGSTEADCRAKCGASITQLACQAACALQTKASCLTSFKSNCKTGCEINVSNCQINCQAECR